MAKQTIETAIIIAKNCARAKAIAGHMADVPYSQAQLCEVIDTLLSKLTSMEDAVTLAKRQLNASTARYHRLVKKTGQQVPEELPE